MRSRCDFTILSGFIAALALTVFTPTARAAVTLAHRYSFSGNVNDLVGGAAFNGTVVDPGAATAVFAGGQLDLSANVGEGSNGITNDAYVNLPNGMISQTATAGNGALSLEFWATVAAQHTWQRFGDFGTSNDGEDTSNGGGNTDYLYISPNSGRFNNGLATETHHINDPLSETGVQGPFVTTTQVQVVGTYDQTDLTAGPGGTAKLYLNGALVGTAPIAPTLNLKTFSDNNNWLGRSQWGDPIFDGSYNEFRVYSGSMSASQVATDFFFGPDTVGSGDILRVDVNKTTGLVQLKNVSSQAVSVDFYRISSAANALKPATWNSLDAQNFGAVDGPDAGTVAGDTAGEGWDKAGGSDASQLVELFLGAAGSSIAANQTLTLGSAFNTAIFGSGNNGDLQFKFSLVGGLQIDGTVNYVTGGIPGDFNADGHVDGADFIAWQRGLGTTFTAGDLANWKANFGSAVAASGAVPEPASWSLLTAVGAIVAVRRRRRG